jgi:hypothetical protein
MRKGILFSGLAKCNRQLKPRSACGLIADGILLA